MIGEFNYFSHFLRSSTTHPKPRSLLIILSKLFGSDLAFSLVYISPQGKSDHVDKLFPQCFSYAYLVDIITTMWYYVTSNRLWTSNTMDTIFDASTSPLIVEGRHFCSPLLLLIYFVLFPCLLHGISVSCGFYSWETTITFCFFFNIMFCFEISGLCKHLIVWVFLDTFNHHL